MRLVQNNVQMVDMSCNICGRPFGRCRHQPGQEYDGVVAGMVMQPIHMTRWDHVRNWFASTNLFELMGMVWFVLAVCNALAWIAERLLWWM